MALDPGQSHRSASPSSGRSSPAPRIAKRIAEDGTLKADKTLRRYGATIERALGSWEISPQEWADYIAFLGRLLKAIQNHPKDAALLPHSDDIAYKLAQCLNPALPSGVHQKALEVYDYIFSTFGQTWIADHLHDFLPGLSAVLSFASLSVRPNLYALFEDHILSLSTSVLRPVLKSLILSLFPALEEEASEDYERAFRILETLEQNFSPLSGKSPAASEGDGYFWQCLFLTIITCPSRRQGGLNFLAQKLPTFTPFHKTEMNGTGPVSAADLGKLSQAAELVISPEPGLLVRCFVCGLSDSQLLIQRGFLDLLVTKLPLNSPLLLERLATDDLDRLVSAATHVLLRREMSLNRRLWTWFLGPEPSTNAAESNASSPINEKKRSASAREDKQFKYFSAYGQVPLERCVLAMFKRTTTNPAEMARPFRICLSLMDRWEVGGSIVPHMFLPAIESAYRYSLTAPSTDTDELLRSASLFFDGIEANLIWANLLSLMHASFAKGGSRDHLRKFRWIIEHFNIKDEEMLIIHIPYAAIYVLALLAGEQDENAADIRNGALEIVSLLLEMVPERAFRTSKSDPGIDNRTTFDAKTAKELLESFYKVSKPSTDENVPFRGQIMVRILYDLTRPLLLSSLRKDTDFTFGRLVSVLLTLHTKLLDPEVLRNPDVLNPILTAADDATMNGRLLTFPTITSILSLLWAFESTQRQVSSVPKPEMGKAGPALVGQIWQHLSPSAPKYHVEAVKSIWQLQEVLGLEDCIESSLTALVRGKEAGFCALNSDRIDSVKRFAVLWDHTVPAPMSSAKYSTKGLTRRGSSMPVVSDAKQALARQKVLTEPLMIVLDLLTDPDKQCIDVVKGWLRNLLTLEQVLNIHFDAMGNILHHVRDSDRSNTNRSDRLNKDSIRQLDYILSHFHSILRHANEWTWRCITEMSRHSFQSGDSTTGIVILAEYCCEFLCNDDYTAPHLEQRSAELLNTILSAPTAASLKKLDLDSKLISRLMTKLSVNTSDFQGQLLELAKQSLRLRTINEPHRSSADARPGSSSSTKRTSISAPRPSPNTSNTALLSMAPSQLPDLLQLGFSSPSSRPQLDQWTDFLSSILPIFADAIFTSLIPLVECLCTELDKVHNELVSISKLHDDRTPIAPEVTTMALLDALELVLARAHECLVDEHIAENSNKAPVQPRSLLGSVASGVFKAEGPPSKTTQANSRLTVVLAFQDAIRVSSKLWTWATQYSTTEAFDRSSAATTSYNALRVRNRTRYLLEQMFAVEPLESLEVVISNWWYSPDSIQATAALDLLHVVQGLRPKNIVPTTLDALCSRTNPVALPAARQSCQTTDLTALEVALFLSAYLQSTEDDAMDEIWSDCMSFFRDVLSNPLPYRQVLPALLSMILLLAQKVDNTNFGEQRKMRRDLGDIFLRFLTATFTAMPAGTVEMQTTSSDAANSSTSDQRSISLVSVLKQVTTNIEVILESSDRILSAINSMSSNLISLVFRAKAFPKNVTSDFLGLLLQMSKKAPSAKSWKKELLDAFNDPRLLASPAQTMQKDWFPLLRQWCLQDKERVPELLSRLTAPSSAGIMFGVGASAARLEADRKAQLNLRRLCLLLLACPDDSFVVMLRIIEEKLVELFDANPASSPSSAVKAELFMVCRALTLSLSSIHLAPLWPIMNSSMQSALMSLLPNSINGNAFSNLSLLQACKLLDLLVAMSPDEFQLHEWLYVTDTIDAVYQPSHWVPTALSDQVAEALTSDGVEDVASPVTPTTFSRSATGKRRPLLDNSSLSDKEDIKVMARDDFAHVVLQPFLGQLSLHAYEVVYSMDPIDLDDCRRNLLEDLLDLTTIVE